MRGATGWWMLVDMRENQRAKEKERRPRRSRPEWAEEVRRWREGGRTAVEYATQRGLHPGTLAAWGRKIDGAGGESGAAAGRPMAFLPVRVAEVAGKEPAPGMATMEVLLLNGRRVRVGKEFDGAAVARLLDAAEGGVQC
ncbi:MAG: hypothetical protein ABJA82_07515 [Myxococcales bacterium]